MPLMNRCLARVKLLAIIFTIVAATLPPRLALDAQGRNLLQNPGFEGDFEIQCSFPGGKPWVAVPCNGPLPSMPWQTVMVAKGWVGWWQPPSTDRSAKDFYQKFPNYCGTGAPAECVAWHQPEFRDTRSAPQDPPRIRSGQNSQKYFSFWSVHQGGLYQVVEGIRPGTPLRFSVYMEVWSSTKLGDEVPNPHLSFGQTSMHLKVGIDPTGGTDPWSPDIVWSTEKESYDQFSRFEVQAVARSNKVTVFTHSRPENPMMHNDVYVDDAELTPPGGLGPSEPLTINPPPALQATGALTSVTSLTRTASVGQRITHIVRPGDTLFALALQYGVPVDQILALNGLTAESQVQVGRELLIAEASAPVKPQPSLPASQPLGAIGGVGSGRGTVCVQAFDDADADGKRLQTEALMAVNGLQWTVLNAQGETVAVHAGDSTASEYCFADLPATTYRVLAQTPSGYAPTLQDRWAVALPSDEQVEVQFGVRVLPEPPPPIGLWLAVGLGGLIVILSGVWLVRRQRRRLI